MPDRQRSVPTVFPPPSPTTALNRLFDATGLFQHPKLYRTLLELADTTVIAGHDPAVGNLVAFITDPLTRKLLSVWGDHSTDAGDLSDLAEYLTSRKPFLSLRPIADAKSGRLQLQGELDRCFLLALLIEKLPSAAEDPDRKLFQLRVWLVVHAFLRNRRGIRLDGNVRTVATALRIGCDNDRHWRALFLSLPVPHGDRPLREFNFRLNTTAHLLSREEQRPPKERKALNALIDLATNKDKEIKAEGNLPNTFVRNEEFFVARSEQSAAIDLDDGGNQLIVDSANETKLITTKPDPSFTQAERKLSARTVLFATAEGMQYLPWSWFRPNPQETKDLEHWMHRALATEAYSSPRALAISLIWSACALGRTVARMLAIRIGAVPDDEWVFDDTAGEFRRLPPMRKPGWQPNEATKTWIVPVAPEVSIRLPDRPRQTLMHAARHAAKARTLRELWPEDRSNTPEKTILDCLQEVSKRLTRSMLAEVLPQRVFDQHGDAVLARLIASHPQSALAGAHSYAQWSLETVTKLLGDSTHDYPASRTRETALGSRLALLEEPLRAVIEEATRFVRNARTGNPLVLHNAFSAYIVIALLAATGGRPIRSPYESTLHFDFDEKLILIDDKHGIAQQESSRLIPLSSVIAAFIQKRYLSHLLALSKILRERAPGLANEIHLTANSQPSGAIPFFFLVDPESSDWSEITPSNVFLAVGIDWPLPANLFRHRLANRLRTEKLDPEIIDGLLGHGEWGNDTWSIYSFRNWADDMVAARPALESSFRSLRFQPVRGLSVADDLAAPTVSPDRAEAIRYGSVARQRERNRRFASTIRDTKFAIDEYLDGRKLEELDAEALDGLADHLARTPDGMPSAAGAIRLSYLERQLGKAERRSGRRVRPSSQRLFVSDEASLFTSEFRGARETWRRLLDALPQANFKGATAQALGVALSLCIESRVSDDALLLEVAANRGYRVLWLGAHCFLEYGDVDADTDIAGRRFRISSRCAIWSIRAKKNRDLQPKSRIPALFEPVSNCLAQKPKNVGELIRSLARLVAQANAQSFPGVICGVLSGQVATAALGWRDATRLMTGRRIQFGAEPDGDFPTRADAPFVPPAITATGPQAGNPTSALLKAFRHILDKGPTRLSKDKNPRRALIAELRQVIAEGTKTGAAPAVLLLTKWICALAQPIGRKKLDQSTLQRYLTALAWRFESELLSFDLLESDDEELTEAYERVLLSGDKPAGEFELERLESFHRWLQSSFDINSPDWQELPVVKPGLGISSGFIRPEEYLTALAAIGAHLYLSAAVRDSAAMLLLLAYRFGLRRGEALGLRRRDWDDSGERIVVTVESNRTRKLKTTASRRQVPLVFTLQTEENDLVVRLLTRYAAEHGADHDQLLLDVDDSHQLVSAVLETVKNVTGNPAMTIHHARHSAANLVAIHALGIQLPGWNDTQIENDVATTLLGLRTSASRRHSWAVGRFLGHGWRPTTFRSYLHFLFDWADELIGIRPDGTLTASAEMKSIVRLESLPEVLADHPIQKETVTRMGDLAEILELFRLYARGVRTSSIASALSLSTNVVERCASLLENPTYSKRVERKGSLDTLAEGSNVEPKPNSPTNDYVRWSEIGNIARTLGDPAWNRLIAWAKSHQTRSSQTMPPLVPEALQQMVGRSKQLLAWRGEHFSLLRFALNFLEIREEQYLVCGSAHLHQGTVDLAKEAGFRISPRPKLHKRVASKRSSLLQIDSAYTGRFYEPVLSRTALLFAENDDQVIRNRNQLALMTVAIALSQSDSEDNP